MGLNSFEELMEEVRKEAYIYFDSNIRRLPRDKNWKMKMFGLGFLAQISVILKKVVRFRARLLQKRGLQPVLILPGTPFNWRGVDHDF